MSSSVIPFGRRKPTARPSAPHTASRLPAPSGAEVHVCDGQDGGFLLYDISASGGSAGEHGHFAEHEEAVAQGRRLAERIGGTFSDLSSGAAP